MNDTIYNNGTHQCNAERVVMSTIHKTVRGCIRFLGYSLVTISLSEKSYLSCLVMRSIPTLMAASFIGMSLW